MYVRLFYTNNAHLCFVITFTSLCITLITLYTIPVEYNILVIMSYPIDILDIFPQNVLIFTLFGIHL